MATTAAVEIQIGGGEAIRSMGELRKQLKDANFEVLAMTEKFGATSKEAADAAKRVAALKDAVGDAKSLTDAFDPDKKFNAFAGALQGVASGFAVVQGAQALFGGQSKELEQTMLKVQSAMALTQGINGLLAAREQFKNLQSVAVQAFNSIKGAIGSTGIGLLVVALGTLIAKWDDLSDAIFSTSDNQKILNETMEAYNSGAQSAIEKTNSVKISFDLAKKGVISKEEALKTYNKTLGATFGEAKNLNEAERLFREKTDAYIKATALRAQADAILKKAAEKRVDALEQEQITQQQSDDFFRQVSEQTTKDINKKADDYEQLATKLITQATELEKENKITNESAVKEETKRDNEKKDRENKKQKEADQKRQKEKADAAARQKEIDDATKQANENRRKLEEEAYLLSIKNEDRRAQAKLQIEYENARKEIELTKATREAKNAELAALDEKFRLESEQLQADQEAKRQQKLDEEAQKSLDRMIEELTKEEELNRQRIETQKKLDEEAFQAKMDMYKRTGDMLTGFSDLVGRETAAGKAFAVAAATIDTYQAAWSAFKNAQKNPISILGPAYPYIQAGLAVAGGIANIKKILAVKVPGKGTGGSAPGGGGVGGVNAPIPVQAQTTTIDQGQVNQLASATARAFVVESDVSGNQERIRRLNRAARIN